MDEGQKKRQRNPRQDASWLSVVTFAWLLRTFRAGFRRELDLADLYQPLDEHASGKVGERISREWRREERRSREAGTAASLLRVLSRCFGREILLAGAGQALLEFLVRLSRPYVLLQLLHRRGDARGWASALALGVFVDCVVGHVCVQSLMHTGMKIRVACSSLLYRKILSVPTTFADSDETSAGQVLNLLSNDVSRLGHAVYYMHYIWMAPLEAILVFYFLYREVDMSAGSGIALQLLFIPILGLFGRLTNRLTSKYAARTDERLKLTNEVVKGIRAIKMYAWEKPFSNFIDQTRKKELKIVKQDAIITDMSLASEFYIPRLCIFITLLAYVLLDNGINAEKVYVITALYDVLRLSMYTLFPLCLHDAAEALVSVQRLQNFMKIEELPSLSATTNHTDKTFSSDGSAVVFKNFSAKWNPRVKVLENVNLQIPAKSLTAVVGEVGCGKTSLLHAILRELPHVTGVILTYGKISYVPQEPWIFASSLRQNILFGETFDQQHYERVIEVCQLKQDIEALPQGDATLLGEKGINLSGGQRARVNLARAIYRDADIYLFDDPLSACDMLVGRKIFQECMKIYLKDKTIILLTHQFQYLEEVDKIVVLSNGVVEATGTLGELQNIGINLVQVMQVSNEFDKASNRKSDESQLDLDDGELNGIDGKCQTVAEKKVSGSISAKTYLTYLLAGKNTPLVILVMFMSLMHQLVGSSGDYFLAYWVNAEENTIMRNNETCVEYVCNHRDWYIYVYGVITLTTITLCLLQSWSFFEMSMRIANNLHANMFASVISATIDFFNKNPLGRIMNRFSKDMSIVDTEVSRAMIDVIQNTIHILAAFTVVSSVNPWLLIPACLVGFCFYGFSLFFIKTSRSIKRLEAITRSPVFSYVSDSLQGLTTIRALGVKKVLVAEFDDHQDLHSSAWFIFFSGSRGLGMYLDLFCAVFLTCVLFTLMIFDDTTMSGHIGLAITQCMLLINTLQWGVRQFAEMENQMTSVERVLEYSKLTREEYRPKSVKKGNDKELTEITEVSSLTIAEREVEIPQVWPNEGKIEYRNVSLRYDKQGPMVLKNLNFSIRSQEKIGIVGRTGAGKSSLINSLFRLAYIEGDIFIDNLPTRDLGLYELRSKYNSARANPFYGKPSEKFRSSWSTYGC
ncbi:ATP-binding cassette sub-family C member 4-like isoform X2 [Phymastichus coffea]|uniref:ATP-binding cassette sub-family C member 4-like isoform X2 n=1 Tax=Phymastichus coffea TaxID=108790 RepID=UPI00273C2DB9|nr:ATP-binding cassette sub-family C member 4-like isoform X2 [Phymastichus coffea]